MNESERDKLFGEREFLIATLDSLVAHIAVLDRTGKILLVNASWKAFGDANGMTDKAYGVGSSYFKAARASLDPTARDALAGIQRVLSGSQDSFYCEYDCHSPTEQRWFCMRATALKGYADFVTVAHENITERVQAAGAAVETERPVASPTPGLDAQSSLLLVTSDPQLRDVLTQLFETKAIQVHAPSDPEAALESIAWGLQPDCVVADYRLADTNGTDFIVAAREVLRVDVPMFIMSGDTTGAAVEAADAINCILVQKPFQFAELFSLLAPVLNVDKQGKQRSEQP